MAEMENKFKVGDEITFEGESPSWVVTRVTPKGCFISRPHKPLRWISRNSCEMYLTPRHVTAAAGDWQASLQTDGSSHWTWKPDKQHWQQGTVQEKPVRNKNEFKVGDIIVSPYFMRTFQVEQVMEGCCLVRGTFASTTYWVSPNSKTLWNHTPNENGLIPDGKWVASSVQMGRTTWHWVADQQDVPVVSNPRVRELEGELQKQIKNLLRGREDLLLQYDALKKENATLKAGEAKTVEGLAGVNQQVVQIAEDVKKALQDRDFWKHEAEVLFAKLIGGSK